MSIAIKLLQANGMCDEGPTKDSLHLLGKILISLANAEKCIEPYLKKRVLFVRATASKLHSETKLSIDFFSRLLDIVIRCSTPEARRREGPVPWILEFLQTIAGLASLRTCCCYHLNCCLNISLLFLGEQKN